MDYNEQIELLSNEKLINIIESKDDYQKEFWDCAILHAEKRGLSTKITDIVSELEKKTKENKEKILKEANLVELYSDRTIIVFSILFSSIAGAILFSNNLKRLKKKGGENVIIFGIIYTIGIIIIGSLIPIASLRAITYLLIFLGGFIITIHFGSKLYPADLEYKNKNPWKAFIIAFLIVLAIGFIYVITKI